MKTLKKLLVLTFCCVLMITATTVVTEDYAINPIEHFDDYHPHK